MGERVRGAVAAARKPPIRAICGNCRRRLCARPPPRPSTDRGQADEDGRRLALRHARGMP